MKVLVIGGGGREHAIIWKLSQSPLVTELFAAPGNAGTQGLAKNVNINATDIDGLLNFALSEGIDYTVVGPDDVLGLGVVDKFEEAGLNIFGPRKSAAIIETSKAFSKELMKKYGIPTAAYEVFDSFDKALQYIKMQTPPIVLKSDGLALGKGVFICDSIEKAEDGLKQIMLEKIFGDSGNKVVVEEFMTGPEVSVLAFCDGKSIKPMVSAQDHKRAYDGDRGPNTGGMGTISPARHYTKDIETECNENIFKPTLEALIREGIEFRGIIFFGLMLTEAGVRVIEYNARFGDPETQVVLPRLKNDLMDVFLACTEQRLSTIHLEWDANESACVMVVSGGYPDAYKKNIEIKGLSDIKNDKKNVIFHSGTKTLEGKTVTNGGRVLGVTSVASDLEKAIKASYEKIKLISFENMYYRKDIGIK